MGPACRRAGTEDPQKFVPNLHSGVDYLVLEYLLTTGRIRYQVEGFVQLLFTTFLRRYFDSQVPRPIYGNKRRFPRRPVSWILSLNPELFTVDPSRRPSREARARARHARAVHVIFQNRKFKINSGVSPVLNLALMI
jgi:hypothetical protein